MIYTQKRIDRKLKCIIVGLLLGDANIQVFQKPELGPPTTARLRIIHSANQVEYLKHKWNLFECFIRQKQILFMEEKRAMKTYSKCYFNTQTLKQFAFFYHLFYKQDPKTGKVFKVLPKLIHRYLEPITLAYWYMDDGSLKWKNRDQSKAVRICTDSFTKKEVQHLIMILNKKYQLNASIFRARSRFRIYIPNTDREFSLLIQDWIHPSMAYKVP